jgi:alkanesulfonate monooxygenase
MLEAYTALGYIAANTRRVQLHTLVSAVTYREPGMLAKQVTTLDVLSGGRAWLGIGAAWNEEEALGLGLPFPPLAERFERLEETLQICLAMWAGEDSAHDGRHYRLARMLNSPASLARPRPRIMIGGAGERKTLRLVARYADACNLINGFDLAHKLDVLRGHCEREGRDYDEIEKTTTVRVGPGGAPALLESLREAHDLGFTAAYTSILDADPLPMLERIGTEVVPQISSW